MTDDVQVEDAGGAGGAIVPTDPAAGASGQPLQVWLARVVGTTDAISPDDLFDGDLLARALIELERRADGTATGGAGDATADEVFSHEDLGAALDRAGLLKECAGALEALTRGFNDWNGRDPDAPLRILAAVYAHYLRNRDRAHDGGEIPGHAARDGGDADPGPGDRPSPSPLSPTKPVREQQSSSSNRNSPASSATRLSQSLTAIHPATESPIKPQTPGSGGFKASPAEAKAAQAARERAKAAAAAAAVATGQLLGETASLRASLASLRASLTPSETDALVSGDALDVARASMAESFVPPLPSDDDDDDENKEEENKEEEEEVTGTNPEEAGVLDALMAEARVDHLADETAASERASVEGLDRTNEGTGSRRALEVQLPSAASFDRSLSSSPAATPTASPARPTRPSRFSHADDKESSDDDDEEEEEEEEEDGVWQPSPSAAEEAQRDLIERLAGLPLEEEDDDARVSARLSAPGASSSVDASTDLSRIGAPCDDDDDDDGRVDWSDDFRLPSPPGLSGSPAESRGDPAARMAMDARKRQIEAVRADEARAYGERRRAAGKEALMRFFASKKAEGGDRGPTVKASTGVRKPLKLKSPNGAATVHPASASPPVPAAATRGDATLPRVATLRPGRGRWSRDPTEPPPAPVEADSDRSVPTETSAVARDPRAGRTPPPRPTTARRVSPNAVAANLPRVATHDPELHARSVRANAAFFAAEESVSKLAMSAAATKSRMDIERDEGNHGMPDRRPPAPPLPKVAAFSPGQVRHERRREPAEEEEDDDDDEYDKYVNLTLGAGEDVDENSTDGRVGDAPPDAFPAWFGVVDREGGRGVDEGEPTEEEAATAVDEEWGVPGLATGSSGIVIPGLSSPAVTGPSPASPSPARFPKDVPKKSPPNANGRQTTKKGEAMWVDLAAWDDASRAGIPSGAWGVGDGQMKKMAPKIGAAEVKKRSAKTAAEARERKMGALVAAGITGTNRKTSKTSDAARDRTGDQGRTDPRLFKTAPPLSNKKLVRNALRHVCLAGAAMRTQLDEALRALDAVAPDVATVFVILFRENTSPHKYRALYALVSGDGGVDDTDGVLVKIHGTGGPARVGLQWVDATMKYDSGQREFKPLATSGRLTPLTAAVTLVSKK